MDREVLSITLSVILIIVLLVLIAVNDKKIVQKKIIQKNIQELKRIENIIKQKNPLTYRDLIIRLDNILAKSLQAKFKNNESCGENLKKSKSLFDNDLYDKIWKIHKIRNQVVHENKEVNIKEVLDGLTIIKKAVKKIL